MTTYSVKERKNTGSARRRRSALALLSMCLAISISVSCSRQEKTAEAEAKESAEKAAPAMPAGAMALSAVLKAVESAGYAPVVEVEFEKDHWQMKAYSNGQLVQLKIDLIKGAVIANPPPKVDKQLSEVVRSLEEQGYGPIVDIEHEREGSGILAMSPT